MLPALSFISLLSCCTAAAATLWTRVNVTARPAGLPIPRCIDGTPPAYYLKPGSGVNASKWILFFEGGGWCTSLDSCYERAGTPLGSSLTYPEQADWSSRDILIDDDTNPSFSSWTSIYYRYSDGQSRAGSAWDPVRVNGKDLYFRGLPNLLGLLQQVLAPSTAGGPPSLLDATHLLISGSSAGGLTTILHADLIAETVRNAATAAGRSDAASIVIKAVPEVGFFIDGASVWGGERIMTAAYERAQTFSNITGGPSFAVNAACVAANPSAAQRPKCFFAQHSYPFTSTPLFIVNSKVDQWQLSNILAPGPNFTKEVSPWAPWQPCINAPSTACNATQALQFANYSFQFMSALNASLAATPPAYRAQNGGVITSCDLHTTLIGGLSHRIKVGGVSLYEALSNWFFELGGPAWRFDGEWPSNPTCAGPHVDMWRDFEL